MSSRLLTTTQKENQRYLDGIESIKDLFNLERRKQGDLDNFLYFNTGLRNDSFTSAPILAEVKDVFNAPFLDDPSSYLISISRLRFSSSAIPLLKFKDNTYKIRMEFNSTIVDNTLSYSANSSPANEFQFYNHYQEMLDVLNAEIIAQHITLKALEAGLPSEIPKVIFNIESNLFELMFPDTWLNVAGLVFSFNEPLHDLFRFEAFEQKFAGVTDVFDQVISDNFNNYIVHTVPASIAGNWYLNRQSYPTLPNWSPLRKILLLSNQIPLRSEKLFGNTTRNIVTDFIPNLDSNSLEYIYNGDGRNRFHDLTSNHPMRTIDLQISWLDQDDIEHKLTLGYNKSMDIKLLFKSRGIQTA